jgi:DNA polymerase (family 10)
LQELEKALHSGKIAKLKGFGEKSQERILKGIGFSKNNNGRFILGFIEPEIETIRDRLANLNGVKEINITGSIRRRKETVGDADILIISDKPKPIMDFFVNMKEVADVIGHGQTKSSVKLFSGINVDLRFVPAISYGAALNYFTGSKNHNIALQLIAIKNRFKLNKYGLFSEKNGIEKMIAGKTEKDIYKKLGLDYIEQELREKSRGNRTCQKS